MAEKLTETIKMVKGLAAMQLSSAREERRVEIIMLKFREDPEIIDPAISRIIHNTDHPFKLTIFDNRPLQGEENNRNTSRIWNFLTKQATCPYVLIIDSDAYVPVRKEGEKCWLTLMMESIDETGIVVPVLSAQGGAHQYVSGPGRFDGFRNKDAWSGCCFLFNKNRIWESEKFDNRFYIYGQDSEWAVRTGRKFGGAVMRKDVFVHHIGGASFKSDPLRDADKLYARELYKFLTKFN